VMVGAVEGTKDGVKVGTTDGSAVLCESGGEVSVRGLAVVGTCEKGPKVKKPQLGTTVGSRVPCWCGRAVRNVDEGAVDVGVSVGVSVAGGAASHPFEIFTISSLYCSVCLL